MDEVRKVIEGDLTIHYITIRKNFTGDFPIVLDIHTGGFGEFNGPKDGELCNLDNRAPFFIVYMHILHA